MKKRVLISLLLVGLLLITGCNNKTSHEEEIYKEVLKDIENIDEKIKEDVIEEVKKEEVVVPQVKPNINKDIVVNNNNKEEVMESSVEQSINDPVETENSIVVDNGDGKSKLVYYYDKIKITGAELYLKFKDSKEAQLMKTYYDKLGTFTKNVFKAIIVKGEYLIITYKDEFFENTSLDEIKRVAEQIKKSIEETREEQFN